VGQVENHYSTFHNTIQLLGMFKINLQNCTQFVLINNSRMAEWVFD
jgi:hypothetical protein